MDREQLDLSADVIAGIYAGDITNWNDPAIANDDPGADLPDLRIVPVHRYDTSGTTEKSPSAICRNGRWTSRLCSFQ